LSSGIKVAFSIVTISALVGFTLVSTAEGAVSWNGFLKEIGFPMEPQIIKRTNSGVINPGETPDIRVECVQPEEYVLQGSFIANFDPDTEMDKPSNFGFESVSSDELAGNTSHLTKGFGFKGTFFGLPHGFTVPTTLTMSIVCINPSVLTLAVGGEWQATDTTALIIGYSVLNAYWIAPMAVGIGLGIYLVKRKID